ncbi:transcriptional regulator GcvA [Lonepinella koalarum]|uniref:LysR family glycine cleavage system transcriptional activator n=1 Tax=Lonepinella koalarum TaxID=53417 RepID=A0A4R1KVC8_9PAST|nr:transcriptional regulator GcvA [Lonepinella koalarum]MDH2927132.1 transcriptional regulator [Lonepinella koalarum]TCK68199.1 LysR family glycine cleavage system transcriptional activator [Lonepinella koalarum]TFJ89411.1 transcriptional regulator GcvA [Lonepinella koalarum]TYG33362.1 transcriptional regulator GcvA [Lonepinella koalarum]
MGKRLPPLNSLKAFESSATHLSFTKAAEELFVTQAAVSHQIKLLEDFLGIELFIRKNRLLELTEKGKLYYGEISPLLQKLAHVTEKIMSKDKSQLNISVPQTFAIQWLVPHLFSFNQLYPDIEVRIRATEQDEGILNKDIDVAIYYGYGNWDNLYAERLAKADLVILASPKLLEKKPIHSAQDLQQHQLIHIHNHDNWQMMAHFLNIELPNVQNGCIFSHTLMALQTALYGQGLILANQMLAQQEIDQGNLQIVLPMKLPDPKSFYVVNNQVRNNEKTIQSFRHWIVQEIDKSGINKEI